MNTSLKRLAQLGERVLTLSGEATFDMSVFAAGGDVSARRQTSQAVTVNGRLVPQAVAEHYCGSACCLLGEAAVIFHDTLVAALPDPLLSGFSGAVSEVSWRRLWTAVPLVLFDIDEDSPQWWFLFSDDWDSDPYEAAKRIYAYLEVASGRIVDSTQTLKVDSIIDSPEAESAEIRQELAKLGEANALSREHLLQYFRDYVNKPT